LNHSCPANIHLTTKFFNLDFEVIFQTFPYPSSALSMPLLLLGTSMRWGEMEHGQRPACAHSASSFPNANQSTHLWRPSAATLSNRPCETQPVFKLYCEMLMPESGFCTWPLFVPEVRWVPS
jgi:hypothetical protein